MDKKIEILGVAYFLGALGAWLRQLDKVSCLSEETISLLSHAISEAMVELNGGKVNG